MNEEELRTRFATEFVRIMTDALTSKCIGRCIRKPGTKLERPEEACLVRCMDAYLESWNAVSRTVNSIHKKLAAEMARQHHPNESTSSDDTTAFELA